MSDLIDRDAAIAAIHAMYWSEAGTIFVDTALNAIRALPAVEVGVTHLSFDQREPSFHAAGCVIGMYYIIESDVMIDPFKLERPGWLSIIGFPTLEAAKAAAQSDYAARIRSALTIAPAIDPAKLDAAVEALDRLIALNDDYSPFGGELFQDRVDRTWRSARATLAKIKGADHE